MDCSFDVFAARIGGRWTTSKEAREQLNANYFVNAFNPA
jgi:hypothetical protein